MTCPDHHCCKGECYEYCNVVICGGNNLNVYSPNCKIPVGQVDCLDVVEYNVASCNHGDTVQIDDGFLHVRNKCRATFKICSGRGFKHHEQQFPELPNFIVPNTNLQQIANTTTITTVTPTSEVHRTPIKAQPTQVINNHTGNDELHTRVTSDMNDSKVVGEDLGIGIGIGVGLAILAIVGFILGRCYYLKRRKNRDAPLPIIPAIQQSNQTGNPMYGVDGPAAIARNSSMSDRYEEIRTISEIDGVSRTFSEPKYESIKSNPVKFRLEQNKKSNRVTSDQSSIYQTVADDISKQNLERTDSDVIYSSYFREGISSNCNSSTHYFILDPDIAQEEPKLSKEQNETSDGINKVDESAYFVLEEQSETQNSISNVSK